MNTILLIDDEVELRTEIADELGRSGYRVIEGGSGHDALHRIGESRPDLVICDINMPGLTGYEVLHQMRIRHPGCAQTPFIFLSSRADRTDVVEGKRRGADDYITKPIDFDDLLATVAAHLRQVTRIRGAVGVGASAATKAATAPIDPAAEGLPTILDRASFAVFLLDAGSRIIYENRLAANFVRDREFVFRANGRLVTTRSDEAKALSGIVAAAASAGSDTELAVKLSSNIDGRPAIAVATPLSAEIPASSSPPSRCILSVIDTACRKLPSAAPFASAYGLTVAEGRVLQCLLEGQRIADIVDELGTSRNTVTTHLKSIFRKTGTTRQSELMALTLLSAGWH